MNPAELQRLFEQGVGFHQRGDLAAAEPLYLRLQLAAPSNFSVLQMLGVLRGQQGRNDDALNLFAAALRVNPKAGGVWMNYGNVLRAMGRGPEALAAFEKALALSPGQPDILYNRSAALLELGRPADALAGFDQVLRLNPGFVEAWSNRGFVLSQLSRLDEALASYDKALALRPRDPDTLNKRGIVVSQLGRGAEGLANFEQAIALAPGFVDAWCNRANALRHLGRLDEALASCDRALALRGDFAPALDHKGIVLWEMRRYDEALASYDRALALKPDDAEVLNNRAVLLRDMRRLDEALASADRALALQPDYAEAHYNRANILHNLKRFAEALAGYERARALDPAHRFALSGVTEMALNLCDWEKVASVAGQLRAAASTATVSPLILLGYGSEPAFQRQATANFLRSRVAVQPPPLARAPYGHGKIRVAYLSADFNRHPVASQIVELIERHDRSRFEAVGISFGKDDGSSIRARLVNAFDAFHDVAALDSRTIAQRIRSLEIDILVDLGGHTLDSRADILAHHPAPLQVSYLGYPATMAAPFIDYILADAIVLPPGQDAFYDEKIVRLPHSYWTGAREREIPLPPSRADAGLPAEGFVFCAFNNHWKTNASMFDVWIRLLAQVPGSVLWLKDARGSVRDRLRVQAQARGIDPARLVFAPPLDNDREHLARQQLADLFLDTLPYNAHATASDALSPGLPLVTCVGNSFSSRVAASMLNAVRLPELVTENLADYEALALALARDPERLNSLRARLAENLSRAPLFDSARTARAIEAAFTRMQAIARRGEPAQAFTLED